MVFDTTFRKLSLVERQALLDLGIPVHAKAGDVIIHQGTRLNGIYVVLKGEVRVEHGIQVVRQTVVKRPNGTDAVREMPGRLSVEVTRLGRGAIFGEMSFVDDEPTSATVTAATEVEAVFIEGGKVHDLLDADPSLAVRFYHSLAIVLSGRLREANKQARGVRPRGPAVRPDDEPTPSGSADPA
ncbi:cyclic nucleotide-binding domain-containing protein [Shumkonia mesophila]|uniref:cyclic nucleotide-binding domain-containing protein n=1 Tax=Shumkonia mesophila TaxID=2838854 RepID=UPI00293457B6|nr:cyclic nucleotide-binding domain-containing protein [Shumkonia mesophila]